MVLLGVLAATAAGVLAWSAVHHSYFDSTVYAGAVRYWFREDGLVYDYLTPGTPYGFTYPPFAGLVMAPMAFLPVWLVCVLASIATVAATVVVTRWLAGPMIARAGWTPWYALSIAVCLALIFEPVRETFGFGQVNMLLLLLVAGDVLYGVPRGRWWGGIGIGLAVAIKLTPGVFLLYLLVTRRWRAAATSIATAGGATLLAAGFFPDASREFWTAALWDTNRVGALEYVSNQSLRGLLARFPVDDVESILWMICVLATLAVWAWRVRRADALGGLALTGIIGTLLSPVTWVHHCVWLLPVLVRAAELLLAPDPAAAKPAKGVGWPFWAASAWFAVVNLRVTFLYANPPRPPLVFLGSNLYVWFALVMLIFLPVRTPRATAELKTGDLSGTTRTPAVSPAAT
jgi:alpha-1,2-mannosyltransferase